MGQKVDNCQFGWGWLVLKKKLSYDQYVNTNFLRGDEKYSPKSLNHSTFIAVSSCRCCLSRAKSCRLPIWVRSTFLFSPKTGCVQFVNFFWTFNFFLSLWYEVDEENQMGHVLEKKACYFYQKVLTLSQNFLVFGQTCWACNLYTFEIYLNKNLEVFGLTWSWIFQIKAYAFVINFSVFGQTCWAVNASFKNFFSHLKLGQSTQLSL